MSRIILSRYPDGQERVVVGYDHPANGCFWQEFNLEINHDTGKPNWENNEEWQEVIRNGGMWPGIPLNKFRDSVPEDLRPLITDEVMILLSEHRDNPNSGYNATPIDLS